MRNQHLGKLGRFLTFALIWVLMPNQAFSHCDGLDGPVVTAAREALRVGAVNLALIWVQKKDESEIRTAFEKTISVRKLSPEAKELADAYFFETLVRVHRAGEGAPYTGLKPAGRDLGLAIPAADTALQTGNIEPLVNLLKEGVSDGVRDSFKHATALKNFTKDDVDAGRKFVGAYVAFIHLVERLYDTAKSPVEGHFPEATSGSDHRHEEH